MVRDSNQERANRQSWRDLQPLPAARASLPLQREFTQADSERVARGLVPHAMEDKWFIFLEENVLYFHRSWTSKCIYQVTLRKDGERYSVAEAYVNRDPDQYSETDDNYDTQLLLFLINNLLLGKDYPFPRPAGLPKKSPAGAYQHHVAGTGYREVEVPSGGPVSKMPIETLNKLKSIVCNPAFLLTLGLVGWFEAIFTVEWSFPYCSNQADGPASAVFGMPLPYIRYSEVSSLEYFYMPSIYVVNILILFVVVSPLVYWAVKKVAAPDQVMRRRVMSVAGLILVLTISAWTFLLLRSGHFMIPVSTVANGYETYTQFRPVRFTVKDLHYDCTPSTFWFKDGGQPRSDK